MPPKKAQAAQGPSKKNEAKKKEKIIEDKTFGLKNKKGNKQQKFIKTVVTQVQHGNPKASKVAAGVREQEKVAKEKEAKRLAALELNALFKPTEQKVPKGVDPKSVLCNYFKQGLCKKGEKCKFSHDLNIGRKTVKKNIYEDTDKDDMEAMDEKMLEEMVNKKHGQEGLPSTTIICKYFLDAVENNKYGWFWECPNGGKNCHYRHALPPGFVLKRDKKKDDKGEQISLEDLIEKERAALSSANLTRITLVSFLKWKEKKKREKVDQASEAKAKKLADYKAGRGTGISGRMMFEFNPDMVTADDEEGNDMDLSELRKTEEDGVEEGEEENYKGPVHEINLESLAAMAQEEDGTGTTKTATTTTASQPAPNRTKDDEEAKKMDVAGAPDPAAAATEAAISAAVAATVNGEALADDAAIDENLFDGEDLDLVEEELDTLELQD